jgi:outer membrane protein assembly factor BamB
MVFIGGADGRLYAVDAATGSIRWRSAPRLSLMDSSPPAVIGSTVFTVGFDHQVYALDTATGTIRWSRPTSGAGGVVAAGPVLLVEEQGGITGVDVSAYGNQILAVDPTSGAELWHALGDFPIPDTRVPGGLLLLDRGGYVFALDRTSRAVEWQLLPSGVPDDAGPAAAQTFIQVDNTVYALNANTGATIWTADIGQYSNGQPVAEDGVVVATSESSFDFDLKDVGTVFAFSDPDTN